MTRILIFSPYALWGIHTIYERTIADACQIRGAKLEYLLCDGILPECDLHWESKENAPRPFDLCQRCQAKAKADMREIDIPACHLGAFVTQRERTAILEWAQSLAPSGFRNASFDGALVGQWVLASVISYFRKYPPDLDEWRVVNVYRGFLYSAAIVAKALRNYLEKNQVDAALLFNGRQSIMRVALELFRERGIRVLTHERAEYCRGHINLRPDTHCMSLKPFQELWKMWADVPLKQEELESAQKWLNERQTGVNLAWIPFNRSSKPDSSLRSRLNLSPERPLWVLFTSSTDETAGDPDMKGPFESQYQWVCDVVRWVAKRSEVQLVIKIHPNLGGNSYIGEASDELQLYKAMQATLPVNVRIVLPGDPVNTYALTKAADLGLTFGSIVGLEMAMLGKPLLLASRAIYENASKVLTIRSRQSLPASLEQCLHVSTNREIQRQAFRLAYYYMSKFEMEFNALSVLNIYEAKANYTRSADLEPGKDITLDRLCGYLIDGTSLYETPSPEDRSRSRAEEDAFFDKLASAELRPRMASETQSGDLVTPAKPMKVSVVLCTYNRSDSLAKALRSVAVSDLPESVPWEVLVVDNNSTDKTEDVVKEFCEAYPGRFRYLFEGRQGKSFALNTGVREAAGDVLAFMDDDVKVERGWLQGLTAPLQNGSYLGAGGRIQPPEDFVRPPWISLEGRSSLAGVLALFDRGDIPIELLDDAPYGTNMAFRREAFEKFGVFRTDLGPCVGSQIRGEDTEFCWRLMRAGIPLLYVPNALVHHDVPNKRMKKRYFLSWYFDYGRAYIRTRARKPDVWIIPRPIIRIANHILVMIPKGIIRWLLTPKPDERFFAMTQIWMMAGETVEIFNQWVGTSVASDKIKSQALGQE
jgi:glycosyltransferase involved in cell wall biosynthesis